jgi:hypothetical protein
LVVFFSLWKAEHNPDRHQIIAENCSIASSVSDNEIKLEKISLLTNRCPSLDSRLSIRFQRIDPEHIKSTIFQIHKFDTTSFVYLRCSIAICYDRIENCQEVNSLISLVELKSFFFFLAFMSRNKTTIIITSGFIEYNEYIININN